jgi:hypothetical protein
MLLTLQQEEKGFLDLALKGILKYPNCVTHIYWLATLFSQEDIYPHFFSTFPFKSPPILHETMKLLTKHFFSCHEFMAQNV